MDPWNADQSNTAREQHVYRSPVDRVLEDGFALLEGVIASREIERSLAAVETRFASYLDLAGGPAGLGLGTANGYREIVQRAPGRFDVELDPAEVPLLQTMTCRSGQAVWCGPVTELLGPRPRVLFFGALVATPGAVDHAWHSDGPHLFDHLDANRPPIHLPPHCLNIFVPLTPQTAETGRLEVCAGSHRLTAGRSTMAANKLSPEEAIGFEGSPTAITCDPGDVVLTDYRVLHRAEPNRGTNRRIVLYATCAAPWFIDPINFPERSLFARPRLKRGYTDLD